MNSFLRWLAFNLVGALGMLVQLAALALFNRLLQGKYLIASAAALEVTLLHNFLWHCRYTWRDRRNGSSLRRQLVRFHLSNGLLSLVGNVALMRLLVHLARLPVLQANAIAILCCSGANFWLSHRWAFSAPRLPSAETQSSPRTALAHPFFVFPLVTILTCLELRAQHPLLVHLHPWTSLAGSSKGGLECFDSEGTQLRPSTPTID